VLKLQEDARKSRKHTLLAEITNATRGASNAANAPVARKDWRDVGKEKLIGKQMENVIRPASLFAGQFPVSCSLNSRSPLCRRTQDRLIAIGHLQRENAFFHRH
jgi:hypothetical protein